MSSLRSLRTRLSYLPYHYRATTFVMRLRLDVRAPLISFLSYTAVQLYKNGEHPIFVHEAWRHWSEKVAWQPTSLKLYPNESCTQLINTLLCVVLVWCGSILPLIHYGPVTLYGNIDLGQLWLRCISLPNTPLPEPKMSYHRRGFVTFSWEQLHQKDS